MEKIRVSIIGASGFTGGELIRLLLFHPNVEIHQVTSESNVGKFIHKVHPNFRKLTNLKFSSLSELDKCDLLFCCLPHGSLSKKIEEFLKLSKRIIDLSADFRLKDPAGYEKWYGAPHPHPQLLDNFVYGIPELHRERMKNAKLISSAGCNATVTILGLYPFFKNDLVLPESTVVEVKVGSSEAGNKATPSSHHPIKRNSVRSYMPTGHRHGAEILQELSFGRKISLHFSATSIDMIRGTLATSHIFLKESMSEKDIWKLFRKEYEHEHFIRIVKETEGNFRYPDTKLLSGTNFCDIGFKVDEDSNRIVVISAIDNLMKGAAGQALQSFNIMYGLDEKTGLEFPGLFPL